MCDIALLAYRILLPRNDIAPITSRLSFSDMNGKYTEYISPRLYELPPVGLSDG
jgi:hypothetical protein